MTRTNLLEVKLCIQLKQTKPFEQHIYILWHRSVARRILSLKEVGEPLKEQFHGAE